MEGNGRARFYRKSMLVFGLIFLVVGFLFLLVPDAIVAGINAVATLTKAGRPAPTISDLHVPDARAATQEHETTPGSLRDAERAVPPHRLYITLAFTMMMMITLICLLNAASPARFIGWVPLLLFSKACSSITGAIVYFLSDVQYLADGIIFLVDFPLLVIIGIIYLVCRSAVVAPE